MKTHAKKALTKLIALLSRLIIRKYRPQIVMVTGSVGKTSTKDALFAALSGRRFVRASAKSYNSEYGVPLTIIGAENPWSSILAWTKVVGEAVALLVFWNHYPKVLVLEVGADSPGDLAKILRIATPDAVVVTRLPEIPVHVEAYASPEAVREEEFAPAYALSPGAPLVVNAEDAYALAYAKRLAASVTTFGFSEGADVRIEDARVMEEDGHPVGMQAAVRYAGESHAVFLPGVVGRPALLASAAAFAAAVALHITPEDAIQGLSKYQPPPGRMRLFRGKGGTTLVDDTYNSSPVAAEEALQTLALIPAKRRIAILGDMLELGRYSVTEHERIGRLASGVVDYLYTVGIRSRAILDAAGHAGMTEDRLEGFASAGEAATAIIPKLLPGDVILAKGSQNNIRLERFIAELLENPDDRARLVRQDKEWKKR